MGLPAIETITSPGFSPARSAGDPLTTTATRGWTFAPKSGSRPTSPRSYFVLGRGVTSRITPLPARSTSTESFWRAFIPKWNRASRQRGVSVPLIETMRSPGLKPAVSPGDPGSTTRTIGGSSS